jgi:Ca2+-binding RTX toxin-like protein
MVTYIKSDLDFILAQIKIAEAHAAGQPLYGPDGLIPSYNIAWGLRTVDGTYNHLLPGQEEWGSSDQPFDERLGTDFKTIMVDVNPGPGVTLMPMSYAPTTVDPDGPDADGLPGGQGSGVAGDVFDPTVRTISNLLVDQTLDNPAAILTALQRAGIVDPADQMSAATAIGAAYDVVKPLFAAVTAAELANAAATAAAAANPEDPDLAAAAAAAAADLAAAQAALEGPRGTLDGLLAAGGVELDGANVKLTNIAPDEGLSASFNSWFTLFGQFFDHGLDLVAKGQSGTVFIPLQPDDPLYVEGGDTNFMVLTRATVAPGDDGVFGTADDVRPLNTTTAYVDQNQTYASHASHQVFLRQYELNADGEPVATGMLMVGRGPDGVRGTVDDGGMATWGDLKTQAAELLGIQLVDADVGNIPLLATDQYGNFLRGPNGYPQIVTESGLVEGDPTANGGAGVLLPADTIFTGHAFLADIAHNAVPDGLEDGDIEIGLDNGDGSQTDGRYDNELLDAHYMAGDGRANENVGLTAVHHVFHAEHNRLVEHTKEVVLASGDPAFIAEWQLPDGSWNGERLFQAAKFGTEMQYQHLVFEEFARKVQPAINTFLVPDGFDTTMDPSIVAEFAHVVYRFGHSMLTESIDRFAPTFEENHISLIEGFLNPLQFENNGTDAAVDADVAAGAIIRGMTRQAGNEIDEFVTSALRNNLLGLPLDLATINLARGRDTGVPGLNAVREQFYEASNQNILLKPYESWVDYAGHLKNEASIINFIAAYGTHDLITGQTTIDGKRDAALTIITGQSVGGLVVPADAEDFLNGVGAFAGDLGGLNDVDLWIGGLAEEIMPFGGMLGSTFGYVFEIQLEMLQSGDRFYYLQRLDGLHLFGEMENNSFASMIMRNTDATHLPSDVFSTPGFILEVDQTKQFNLGTGVFDDVLGNGVGDDPTTLDVDEGADDVEDTGADPEGGGLLTDLVIRNNPSTPGADSNYLRYTGGDHVVLGGTESGDILIAGIGDDTLYGDGGADKLDGGFGNDILNGGAGDDIIVDAGGDDNIKGGDGNDVIHAGPGLDLVLAGTGQDFVVLGTDEGSEVFAGEGNDFILGNRNAERILGNEGNDWIETGTFDGAPGDNFDEVFAHDGIDGHDVFIGDGGFDEFIGEGGDDIMVGSPGRGKMAGMSGFDWATYKDNTAGVNADLSIPIVFDESPVLPENAALEEFAGMEGLSGSQHDDVLRGTNDEAADRLPTAQGGTSGYRGSILDAAGIARIEGLQAILGAGVISVSAGDIILGGAGSDMIEGQGGDDIIDGDSWLNVRIAVHANAGPDGGTGVVLEYADSMTDLMARMFSGELNPGQLSIARQIVTEDGAGDIDTAVFSGARADYDINQNADGSWSIVHARGAQTDGADRVNRVEALKFSDMTVSLSGMFTPVVSDLTPTEGQAVSVGFVEVLDPEGTLNPVLTYQWQRLDGATWVALAGATAAEFIPTQAEVGHQLRTVVNYSDDNGLTWESVTAPTGVTGDLFVGTPGADRYVGTLGDDEVFGMSGNDVLIGGAGSDVTNGGLGNDRHYVADIGDMVIEAVGEGSDRVLASVNYALGAGSEVEILTTNSNSGTAAIDLTGNEFTNTINGNAGSNVLSGGGGDDFLSGLVGNDVTNGGLGNDRHYVTEAGDVVIEAVGEGSDRVYASVDYVLSAGSEVEILTTNSNSGTAAIDLTGNEFTNTINGNAGSNILDGGGGNDRLSGLGGDDTLTWHVGGGRDRLDGGDGVDTVEIVGDASTEHYRIYARADALAAGITGLNANTEIVITRNGTDTASVIAELDNIEEIVMTGMGGGDTYEPIGDFSPTSLLPNTITLNGSDANDTLNISALASQHRVVFHTNGGDDSVVGELRPIDVVEGGGFSAAQFGAAELVMETGIAQFGQAERQDDFLFGGDAFASFGRPGRRAVVLETTPLDSALNRADLLEPANWSDNHLPLFEEAFGLHRLEPDTFL